MKDAKKIIESSTGITKEPIKVREGDTPNDILHEANNRALVGWEYWRDNHDRAEDDVAYIFGEQYTEDELNTREEENRLSMVFNKLPQFINNVIGKQMSSVQTINISPTGTSVGTQEPKMTTSRGKELDLSDILTGLIRDIEYQSNARQAYKTAFKHSTEGGFGWLRVLTKYQDGGFDLDIEIKNITDRWSVIIDPKAKEADFSDANWCFIRETMSLNEFNARYPGKSHEALAGEDKYEYHTFWGQEDTVTVTEYFRREPYKKKIVLLSTGEVYDNDMVEPVLDELEEMGVTVKKEREVTTYKVVWCKISQGDILEKEIEFPTSTIPVVPVLGRVTDTRNKKLLKGLVTDAVDAQIALNKMKSSALERIDSSPLSPFIATDKAIEGYENQWAEANTTKFSTLTYRKGEERPVREQGATMPIAELQTASNLEQDMKSSIGIFNASLGETSNEISGKAIKARQSEADVGTYEFIDNYENAIRRVGLLVVEMIPRIYDTERIIRIRGADGTDDTLEINKTIMDNQTGEEVVVNDLNFGRHTVVISSGASYETKRQENADQIMDLMKVSPQVAQVGADLLVRNLDFAESDVLGERLEKTIPRNLLSKEKQEELAKDEPKPQPTPEEIEAKAEQDKSQMELKMKELEYSSKIELEKIKLQTAQINLETTKIEASMKIEDKAQDREDKKLEGEEDRRNKAVDSVVSQIKPKTESKEK